MRALDLREARPAFLDLARPSDVLPIQRLLAAHPADCVPMHASEVYRALEHFRVIRGGRGEVLASAALLPLDGRRSEIRGVVVQAEARGRGYGELLVEDLIRRGFEGRREVVCVTRRPRYFERLGFERIGLDEVPRKGARSRGTRPRCALVYRGGRPRPRPLLKGGAWGG